jgi:hypothetical protein
MSLKVEFPELRNEVIAALRSLSDPEHQQSQWGRYEEGVNYYDDLTINVHILYDDCAVLPDPSPSVGSLLAEGEVPALRAVHDALGPLLHDLGDRPDCEYTSDDRWPSVVRAARAALDAMQESG